MTDDELFALYSLLIDPVVYPDRSDVSPVDGVVSLFDPDNLPHIAGGQIPPIGLDWGRVLLRLFGRADSLGELYGWLEDRVNELADLIWGGIGGAIRFVYDFIGDVHRTLSAGMLVIGARVVEAVQGGLQWLLDQVFGLLALATQVVLDGLEWVWERVNNAVIFVGQVVLDGLEWVWERVNNAVIFVGQVVLDGLDWLWGQVWDAFGFAVGRLLDGLDWLWGQVWDALGLAVGRLLDGLDWLSDHVTRVVVAGGEAVIGGITDAFGFVVDRLFGTIDAWGDILEKFAIPYRAMRGDYESAEELLDDLTDPLPVVVLGGALVAAVLVLPLIMNFTAMVAAPLFEPAVQRVREKVGATLPPVGDALTAWNRGLVDEGQVGSWLAANGYGSNAEAMIKELRLQLPGPTDLVRFGVREVFTPEVAERFGQFRDFPPQFGALMEFLGFGGGTSGPGAVGGPGGGRTWAEAFWAAHWDLPSPNQAFEMLHRRVALDDGTTFDQDTLRLLLRALDVMPFWRGPLTQIAFRPFTRVDVRRMHLLGILDPRGVTDAYLDQGFDEEKAQAMTEFTIRYNAPDDETELDRRRDLAASQVRLAYRRHIISRDDAIDKLVGLRYAEDDADFLLSLDDFTLALNPTNDADVDVRDLTTSVILRAYRDRLWTFEQAFDELQVLGYTNTSADLFLALEDHKVEQELTDLQVAIVKEDYFGNAIDREAAAERLVELDLEEGRRELTLLRWELERARKTRRLTRAQIVNAWKAELFSDDEVRAELSASGYTDRDVEIVVALA